MKNLYPQKNYWLLTKTTTEKQAFLVAVKVYFLSPETTSFANYLFKVFPRRNTEITEKWLVHQESNTIGLIKTSEITVSPNNSFPHETYWHWQPKSRQVKYQCEERGENPTNLKCTIKREITWKNVFVLLIKIHSNIQLLNDYFPFWNLRTFRNLFHSLSSTWL